MKINAKNLMLSRCYLKELSQRIRRKYWKISTNSKRLILAIVIQMDLMHISPVQKTRATHLQVDDKDSETEILQISEVINQSELRDNDLDDKVKEVVTNEDTIEKVVDIVQEIMKAEKSVSKVMNLMLLYFLTILLITIPIVKFAVNILMCVLILMYMHLFVALSLLEAMLTVSYKLWNEMMIPKLMRMHK